MLCVDMTSSCCGHVSNFTALVVLINKGGHLLGIHDGLVKFIAGIDLRSGQLDLQHCNAHDLNEV
jgi:hypothetical protein